MTFVKTISLEEAEGKTKEIYDDIIQRRGQLSEVLCSTSLNPESVVKHLDLYMTIMFGRSPLKRAQREMIAVIVSAGNDCEYCQIHHAIALNHFWKDDARVEQLRMDYKALRDLTAQEIMFCDYAYQLTKHPEKSTEKIIAQMKNIGIEDRAIVDATLVISYFNFVNRIVIGLGVNLADDAGEGYKFD